MELNWDDSKGKGIQVTSVVGGRALANSSGFPPVALAGLQQEYFPPWREAFRNERMFERISLSCYSGEPFAAFLDQRPSASHALDEEPADDMHRAVSKICGVYAEVCETAERAAATSSRKWGHGKQANDKQVNGMSAGG
jgi:hypothetical protein